MPCTILLGVRVPVGVNGRCGVAEYRDVVASSSSLSFVVVICCWANHCQCRCRCSLDAVFVFVIVMLVVAVVDVVPSVLLGLVVPVVDGAFVGDSDRLA